MSIDRIIADMAETLRDLQEFSGIDVIEQDLGDVSKKLDAALAQTRPLAAIVCWSGFTPKIGGKTAPAESPLGTVNVTVQLYERPAVCRRVDGSPRLLGLARAVAKALDGAASDGMDDILHLVQISPIYELDTDDTSCNVEFKTTATL